MKNVSNNSKMAAIAILLALFAGLFALRNAADDNAAAESVYSEQVLTSQIFIKKGTLVRDILANPDNWVSVTQLPQDVVFPDTLVSLNNLSLRGDQVIGTDINAGAQIREVAFVIPGQQVTSAVPAPEDSFEITIQLPPEHVVGARLRAGHRVAVVGVFDATRERHSATRMVLDNLLVTNFKLETITDASTTELDPLAPGQAITSEAYVTLSGTVEEVEILAAVADMAQLRILRQHEDATTDRSAITTLWDVILLPVPAVTDYSAIEREFEDLSEDDRLSGNILPPGSPVPGAASPGTPSPRTPAPDTPQAGGGFRLEPEEAPSPDFSLDPGGLKTG